MYSDGRHVTNLLEIDSRALYGFTNNSKICILNDSDFQRLMNKCYGRIEKYNSINNIETHQNQNRGKLYGIIIYIYY